MGAKEFFLFILHKKFISNRYNEQKHSEKFADGACIMGEERKEKENFLESEEEREDGSLEKGLDKAGQGESQEVEPED